MVPGVHHIPRGERMQFVTYVSFRSQAIQWQYACPCRTAVEGQQLAQRTSTALDKDEERLLGWDIWVNKEARPWYSQVFLAGENMYRSSAGAGVGRFHGPVIICSSREFTAGDMFGQVVLLRHDCGGMENTVISLSLSRSHGGVRWCRRADCRGESLGKVGGWVMGKVSSGRL